MKLLVLVVFGMTACAQTFTTLHRFHEREGSLPSGALVQATDGDFYGTASQGGANHYGNDYAGTFFKITAGGKLTPLHNFCALDRCTDGAFPVGALVEGADGDFYGITSAGYGAVFKITPHGSLRTLYTFCALAFCADGEDPAAGLVLGSNGDYFGTTTNGGANPTNSSYEGTVFRISPAGVLTTLYSFCGENGALPCLDGVAPEAALVQAPDGDFYGTASGRGTQLFPGDGGTVFRLAPGGELTTLYDFCAQSNCVDGAAPNGLLRGGDGNYYGTTRNGGPNDISDSGDGTFFRITPGGTLTTLYSFGSQAGDGVYPNTGLIQATDGDFYGTTFDGGANCAIRGCGTVFRVTPAGVITTLYSFCSESKCTDGKNPNAGLLQATDGNFYGTTSLDGDGYGTVFKLSVGLGPFVKTEPAAGTVGAAVKILGTNLTGATAVLFNGVAAEFAVVSASEIDATVPAGSATGKVQVVTPGQRLYSDVAFRVK